MANKLGNLLRQLRGDLTLREASESTGLSHSYIRNLEDGFRHGTGKEINPSPTTLKSLAKAYDYSFHDLMKVCGYVDELRDDIDYDGGERRIYDLKRILDSQSEIVLWDGVRMSDKQREKAVTLIEWASMQRD